MLRRQARCSLQYKLDRRLMMHLDLDEVSDNCPTSINSAVGETTPCEKHLNEARQRFRPTLEALGCICRALLARNLESCCITPSRPSSRPLKASPSRVSVASKRLTSSYSVTCGSSAARYEKTCRKAYTCGQTTGCEETCSKVGRNGPTTGCEQTCSEADKKGQTTGCENTAGCSKSTVCQTTIGHGHGAGCENTRGCCDSKVKETACHSTRGTGAYQGQPSCTVTPNPTSHMKRHSTDGLGAEAADIEKASPGIEHVVLSVEGLTCVGCENKLFKSLDVLPQVHNLQTSLLMSQAEFDLDLMNTSVDDVIHSVERATGFKCQRLSRNGQYLHVNASSNTEQVIERILSKVVLSATLLDRQTIRIEYDPSVVGARDLLATIDDSTVHLAPPQSSPALAVGNRHVRHTGLLTLFSAVMTIPVLILAWAPLPQHDIAYGSVSLALATVIQIIVAGPFYPSAIKALVFTHVIEMDLPIVLSTTTAYIFSVVSFAFQVKGAPLSTGEFFETSALLVTLIMLGQFISALARQEAVESISIRSLQFNTTLLVQPDGRQRRSSIHVYCNMGIASR